MMSVSKKMRRRHEDAISMPQTLMRTSTANYGAIALIPRKSQLSNNMSISISNHFTDTIRVVSAPRPPEAKAFQPKIRPLSELTPQGHHHWAGTPLLYFHDSQVHFKRGWLFLSLFKSTVEQRQIAIKLSFPPSEVPFGKR